MLIYTSNDGRMKLVKQKVGGEKAGLVKKKKVREKWRESENSMRFCTFGKSFARFCTKQNRVYALSFAQKSGKLITTAENRSFDGGNFLSKVFVLLNLLINFLHAVKDTGVITVGEDFADLTITKI